MPSLFNFSFYFYNTTRCNNNSGPYHTKSEYTKKSEWTHLTLMMTCGRDRTGKEDTARPYATWPLTQRVRHDNRAPVQPPTPERPMKRVESRFMCLFLNDCDKWTQNEESHALLPQPSSKLSSPLVFSQALVSNPELSAEELKFNIKFEWKHLKWGKKKFFIFSNSQLVKCWIVLSCVVLLELGWHLSSSSCWTGWSSSLFRFNATSNFKLLFSRDDRDKFPGAVKLLKITRVFFFAFRNVLAFV